MILVFVIGGITNLGYALFDNISAFIVFRLFHGLQYALVGTLTMTLAGNSLPKEKMASGMGIFALSSTIGMAIGPTIGIYVLNFGTRIKDESFGFTCVFLFAMLILIFGIIPSYLLSPDKKTAKDILESGAWYKNIASVHAIPMALVMFFTFIGWSLYNVYIVELANELGISGISSFFIVLALVLLISRPASGWLTDKFGLAKTLPPALLLFAVSFIVVGSGKSIEAMLAGAVIAAIGFGSFQPALNSMCILSETPLKRGVATNTLFIGIDLGLFVGPIAGGIVYEMYNYSIMFRSTSLMIVIAILIFVISLPAYYRRRSVLEALETQ